LLLSNFAITASTQSEENNSYISFFYVSLNIRTNTPYSICYASIYSIMIAEK